MGKKTTYFLLSIIVILGFLLRMYLLGSIPPGLTNDEADIGYDAYSVLLTGRDQWGEAFPLTSFKGFGDYRLPLYTYLVAPVMAVMGPTQTAVRIPSALFGVASVVLIFVLARQLFAKLKNKDGIALGAMFFMSVSPWAIGLSRIGIESNVAISIFLAAIILFIYSLKKPKYFFISFILFALTLFTYTSYTVFTPMGIIILSAFYRKEVLKNKKYFVLSIILFIVLVSPLFLYHSTAGVRSSQVSFMNSQDNVGLYANLNDRRGSCGEKFPTIFCKTIENKGVLLANTFTKNYLNHFSLNFLYLNGTNTQYSILPQRSLLYTIELIFLIAGLISLITLKSKGGLTILALLLASAIPDSLTGDGHYSRAAEMMPFIFLLEGFGAFGIWVFFEKFKKYRLNTILKTCLVLTVVITCITFYISYTSYFPKYYSSFSQFGYQDLSSQINTYKNTYDTIYISKYKNDTKQYVYYLFYTKYDPLSFQRKTDIGYTSPANNWVSVDRIGNIHFMDLIPPLNTLTQLKNKKVLLVSHPSEFPKDIKTKSVVRDKNGNGVFALVDLSSLLEYYRMHPEAVPVNN